MKALRGIVVTLSLLPFAALPLSCSLQPRAPNPAPDTRPPDSERVVEATDAVPITTPSPAAALQAEAEAAQPLAPHPAVDIAKGMLGSPYRYGGTTPKGFDCSGLVHYAFTHSGYKVPRTTTAQYDSTFAVDKEELQAGDLLFFKIKGKVSHVGIYVGDDRFIHAPSSGKRVDYSSLSNPYWATRLVKAGRFF